MGWRERIARLLDPGGPGLEAARFTVLDTELTGLDPGRDGIVALGAVRMEGGRIRVGETWDALVRPGAVLDGRSIVIHRIMPSRVEAEPPIDDVLPAFLAWAEGTVLAGHCLAIDLAFLAREARRLGLPVPGRRAVDTLALYGWLRQRLPAHPALRAPVQETTLYTLARALGAPVAGAHTALGDAYLAAQVLQRLLPLLAEAGVTGLDGLLRVGDPRRQAQGFLPAEGGITF